MPSALEKLVKILKLEQDQGYKNTAVIGGLGAFSEQWTPNAHRQARIEMHHLLVDDLSQLMEAYADIDDKTARRDTVAYMLDRIMMRVTDPREDFTPRHNWNDTDTDAPPPKPAAKPKSTPPPRKRASSPAPQPPTPTVPSDLPPEPRLERPPRQDRPFLEPDEAADIMRGLASPITVVKGVGEKMAEKLGRLGIERVEDMLYYLPNRYDDYTKLLPLYKLKPEMVTTVVGTVRGSHIRAGSGGRKDFAYNLDDGTGQLLVTCFGQRWLRNKIRDGHQLVLSGKVTIYQDKLQMTNPEWEPLESDNLKARGIVPVYGLTEGLKRPSLTWHDGGYRRILGRPPAGLRARTRPGAQRPGRHRLDATKFALSRRLGSSTPRPPPLHLRRTTAHAAWDAWQSARVAVRTRRPHPGR